jgi:hypothetical protein
MRDAFQAHGIDEIHEDDFDRLVLECYDKVYMPARAEFKRRHDPEPVFKLSAPWGSDRLGAGRMIRLPKIGVP